MKKFFKRSLVMTLVTVLLIGTFAISADAVAKRTVKYQKWTTTKSVINKKAAKVKKGTTNLTIKKGEGYIKFTAPSTKTYSFNVSNLKVNGGTSAHVTFYKTSKYSEKDVSYVEVSTKGGKNDALFIHSVDRDDSTTGPVKNRHYKTRTGKLKLKKGETVYLYFWSVSNKTHTMKLNIK